MWPVLESQLKIALPGFYEFLEKEALLTRAVEAMLLAYDLGQEHYIDHVAENAHRPELGQIMTRPDFAAAERVARELEGKANANPDA